MAGKYSPGATLKIMELEGYYPQVMRINALVEQYVVAKGNTDNLISQIKRVADQLKLKMMMSGQEGMSQIAGAILMTAARSGNQGAKGRALREHVGNLKFQLELAVRTIQREDEAAQRVVHAQKEATKAAEKAVARAQEQHAAESAQTTEE